MKNNKTAIIGVGYVGNAFRSIFPDAVLYDPFNPNIESASKEKVNTCDFALICVPTPTSDDGKTCDISIVEDVFSWLEVPLVLIKSTIKPGTTQKLQQKYPKLEICFSPEYIGEGNYFIQYWNYPDPHDPKKHDFMIVGGTNEGTGKIIDIFVRKVGPHMKFMRTDAKTAEVIKYTENMWIATKVTFVNEMYEVCNALGVDWRDVREGWLLDKRVSPMFSAVFQDKRGFEGKCLPKDTKALIASAEAAGYDAKFLKEVLNTNNRIRKAHGFDKI